MNNFEKLDKHVFVTKLAGFEHTEYIQKNQTRLKKENTDIPLVQGKNIKNGVFKEKFDWYISKDISDKLIRSKLTKDAILIPYVGSNLGEVGIFYHNYDCHMASNIAKIELIDDYFDLEYLKYYFQSNLGQSYLFQSKQGSAQPNITMDAIRNTNVLYKPKNEQILIGNFFKKIDDLIYKKTDEIELLDKIVNKIFNFYFLQFEFPNSEGKPYTSNNGLTIYNSDLKRNIPVDWKVNNLYEIADFINGLACQKHRPINNTDKLPVIKIKEMNDGFNKDTEYVSSNIEPKYIINDGDILFSWSASLETMIWSNGIGGLNQHIFKVVPKNNYPKSFVYYQLSNYIINFVKMAQARKTTMGHITSDHIKLSRIAIPPMSVIEDFDKKVNKYLELMVLASKEVNSLKEMKKYYLNKIINGQIKIKEVIQ